MIFLCVILLHIIPLILITESTHSKELQKSMDNSGTEQVNILVPESQDIQVKLSQDTGVKYSSVDSDICFLQDSDTYIGVGIIVDTATRLILYIPEYYPAYKAGLRLGDYMFEPQINNGYMDFDIIRGYERLKFHIKMERICYVND